MGELVAGFASSHTAMMIRKYDVADSAQRNIRNALSELRMRLLTLSPDLVVVVSSEHLMSFFYDSFPQICISVGTYCTGWGDAGIASFELPIASDFGADLLKTRVASGFDLCWSVNPELDHAFMAPLNLLMRETQIPIVSIFLNASTEPLPPFSRCPQLGTVIRSVVDSRPNSERAVLLGTGRLSHWVGTSGMGKIDVSFDMAFLESIKKGDLDSILNLDVSQVIADAGNGAQEIRSWITIMSAKTRQGRVFAYEPISSWATGIALAQLC